MGELANVADLVTMGTWVALRHAGRPEHIGNIVPPQDLYSLTFGELKNIEDMAIDNDMAGVCCLLLGITPEEYNEAPANEMMAFTYWVARELESIGKMFASMTPKYTPEQLKAGAGNINHGLFGTLDWYCRRMGITDHTIPEAVPWVRIYKCMKIDYDNSEYERKLMKVYEQERKSKRAHK